MYIQAAEELKLWFCSLFSKITAHFAALESGITGSIDYLNLRLDAFPKQMVFSKECVFVWYFTPQFLCHHQIFFWKPLSSGGSKNKALCLKMKKISCAIRWIGFTCVPGISGVIIDISVQLHIPIFTASRVVKYGGVKWKLLWVAPAPYFQKAS